MDAEPDRLSAFSPMDPANKPEPFKHYAAPSVPLPRDLRRSSLTAADVLSGRRGEATPLDESLLGTLLFLAGGVTRVAYQPDGAPLWFRASMSAGNLHPVEIYVLGDGVFHYQPLEHALAQIGQAGAPLVGDGATIVLTGIPFRTCWKYGELGWRHLWWDAGGVLANLLAAADAHGVPARVEVGFGDETVQQAVGIDGVDEVPLAILRLGAGVPDFARAGPVLAPADPVADQVLRFPLLVNAQHESKLGDDEVGAWRAAATELSHAAPDYVEPPARASDARTIEDVILRRGSTRVFRQERVAPEVLQWSLAAATRAATLDCTPAGTLIEHSVNVHDVAGLEPGGYAYLGGTRYEGRSRTSDARAYGSRMCRDQALGGDSAYTVFHLADLARLGDRLGRRAERAALLEAGLVAGRLSLNAVAVGAGATGLTFYEDLVSQYFRTDASTLLATAVGVPSTAPAKSGTPGAPVVLRRYPPHDFARVVQDSPG